MNIKAINTLSDNIYKSKTLQKGLKTISENSAMFVAGTTLALSSVVRPVSTLLAPKADKEDKKISCIKSISSAIAGFIFMALVSVPFAKGIKKIDTNPSKYLNNETVDFFKKEANNIQESKAYQLITQTFKLGLGFLLAYPKALFNNAVIPPLMDKVDNKKEDNLNFKGSEKIVSKALNNSNIQNIASKLKNTNFILGMIALSDIFSTAAFINITSKNKKLDDNKKKVLNYNAAISTGLCIGAGVTLDKLLDKPTEAFIKNLKKYNPESLDFAKWAQGAKIAKTSLLFGAIYYFLIPMLSTTLSSILAKNTTSPDSKNNI